MTAVVPTAPQSPEITWPDRPLTQIGIADTCVVIRWKSPRSETPVTGYLIRDDSGRYVRFLDSDVTQLLLDGLEPGTRYQIVVTARAGEIWCSPSCRTRVQTSGLSPAALEAWELRSLKEHDSQWDPVAHLLDQVRHYPVLTAAEEIELGKEIGAEGPTRHGPAFWRFAISNLRLVVHWARRSRLRVEGTILDFEDLVQVGFEGLLDAVERWDWRKGFKFSTYGSWWIRQRIDREIANRARTVRLPVHVTDEITQVVRAWHSLGDLVEGSEEAYEEVAGLCRVSAEHVRYLLGLIPPPLPLGEVSLLVEREENMLDRDLLGDEGWLVEAWQGSDRDEPQFGDLLNDAAKGWLKPSLFVDSASRDALDQVENREAASSVVAAWKRLPDRDRRIVDLRYGLTDGQPRTYEEIGQELGLTRERIRQLLVLAEAVLLDDIRSR